MSESLENVKAWIRECETKADCALELHLQSDGSGCLIGPADEERYVWWEEDAYPYSTQRMEAQLERRGLPMLTSDAAQQEQVALRAEYESRRSTGCGGDCGDNPNKPTYNPKGLSHGIGDIGVCIDGTLVRVPKGLK